MIREVTNDNWEKKVKNLSTKDNLIWRITKSPANQNLDTIPTLHAQTGLVFSDEDKGNALTKNFERVHHLTAEMSDRKTEKLVKKNEPKN